MTRPAPPAWQVWTALWLVYVLWGSTYLGIAYVVDTMPPLVAMGLRFGTACLVLVAVVLVRRGPQALRVTRRQARNAGGIGLLLLLGGNGAVALAESAELPSGLAALLVAVIPLWVVLLRWVARDRPSARTVAGVALGFVGLAVLLLPGARPEGVALLAVATVLGGAFLWSLGSFWASRADLPADGLTTTALEMGVASVALVLVGLARGERLDVAEVSTASWLGLAYLVVFGSLVAFTAFSWLLQVAPVSQVATYAYVNPVVAVALGAVLRGEDVTRLTLVGGGITVLAVAVVVREEGRRRAAAGTVAEEPAPVTVRT
ncbi:MAG TPA: EamA family transporter [Mycobacteriales bacterium]|nr:EamA family transporter [Mycobacteriales bacterium]